MMKHDVLTELQKQELRDKRDTRDKAFDELDRAVLDARIAGATFREIAESTGMSVAWVQQVLVRADPEQKHYTKRKRTSRV